MSKPANVVTSALVVTATVGLGASIAHGSLPSYRKTVGIGTAFLVLSFLAGPSPELAAAFAVLVTVAVVMQDGPVLFGALTSYMGDSKP